MTRIFAVLAMLLLTLTAQAQIYKCVDEEGNTEFSQRPCASDAEKVTIKDNSSGVDLTHGDWSRIEASNREREIKRAIEKHEGAIRRLQNQRDAELARLRAQKSRAANNQAGATWLQSIATEMQAVSSDYAARIDMEREAIRNLRSQR